MIAAEQALAMNRPDHAAGRLGPVLASHPDHPEVLRLHASLLSLRGDHRSALREMQRALEQRPQEAFYHNAFALLLAEVGELDRAIEFLLRACELQPHFVLAWYNLGLFLTRSARFDEARDALRHAVALAPDYTAARAQLADLLRMDNFREEATAEYRRLLAEQPWAGMAWWGLAEIKTLRLGTADSDAIRRALTHPRATDGDRIAMGFALAKALDDQGRYAESMQALAAANDIARRHRTWSAAAFAATVESINAATCTAGAGQDLGSEVIFIVGMPRSGSTLIEQILASHSNVEGTAELTDLPVLIGEESARRRKPYPKWLPEMGAEDWLRLGRRYLERTARWRSRRPIFTDKLPNNWMHIGMIRAMLPGARIVISRRDALETCFSCYRQYFPGNDYTRNFSDLAGYWRSFDATANHWAQQEPTRVYQHAYEELVADAETNIRALLVFCGLPFEAACLRFNETRRSISTPSAMQVREPLRADTSRAPRYGELLNPLRQALFLPLIGEQHRLG
ncbi:tetratricopeptide repeat-containing sulfotransferase family protein [Dyella flagellata]|uniref:tetratricopeptide repeat-containing sulfotransferase family protein n=1 Tax=Dyella flagellata TaxID=1867833 RepID=UPI0024E0ABEC|nr:tetratricopeptide repeat-containing sulfotransferase family protein [Dyella flagellata]